ncbi:LOW QUALITY PROTEIN: hypothetical protein ACG7TL_001462 [Trametes sanguinea]
MAKTNGGTDILNDEAEEREDGRSRSGALDGAGVAVLGDRKEWESEDRGNGDAREHREELSWSVHLRISALFTGMFEDAGQMQAADTSAGWRDSSLVSVGVGGENAWVSFRRLSDEVFPTGRASLILSQIRVDNY